MVAKISEKTAIGCTSLEAVAMYADCLSRIFPNRKLFVIKGDVSFKRRLKIIEEFEATKNGILICTQQSLKSSVNIPTCNEIIMEALQWNIPKMEQFYFRFIRLDSEDFKNVHFVSYENSIEQNMLALILTKERINDFIKTGVVTEQSAIFDEYNVSPSLIDSLLRKETDKDGRVYFTWGSQKVA